MHILQCLPGLVEVVMIGQVDKFKVWAKGTVFLFWSSQKDFIAYRLTGRICPFT
jgi:hypothetical protein